MKSKRILMVLGLASIVTLVSACSSDDANAGTKDNPIIIGEVTDIKKQADTFSHIHGLSKHPNDNNKILLASHEGLMEYDKEAKQALYVGTEQFDLMGYMHIPGSTTLVTSGHPGPGSKLPNPLGVLWSDDAGQTWEVRGLYGMIDFHALAATSDKSRLLGQGSDGTNNVLIESYDQGYTWDVLKSKGVPLSHEEFFQLGLAPNNGDIAYAATAQGLFYSDNGGKDWVKKFDGYITALKVLAEDEIVFYEASENGLFRLKGDEFISYGLYLGADAVNYIVVDDPSLVTVSTFENNILETTDHGAAWKTLLKEGKF